MRQIAESILGKLEEIEAVKYVDMYYSQDESKMNVVKYPACLLGFNSKTYNDFGNYTINFGLLVLIQNIKSNKEKELDIIDLIDEINGKIRGDRLKVESTSCIERTSNISVYYVDIFYDGDWE